MIETFFRLFLRLLLWLLHVLFWLVVRCVRQTGRVFTIFAAESAKKQKRLQAAQQSSQRRPIPKPHAAVSEPVWDELTRYAKEVASLGVLPRTSDQAAKVPVASIHKWKSDVREIYGQRARRTAVCFPLGLWVGEFAHDGKYVLLIERAREVQRFVTTDTRAEADRAWAAVTEFFEGVNTAA